MSFFKPTERVKKIAARVLIFVLVLPFFFLAKPPKTQAIFGFGDIVIDPTNLVQNTLNAAASVANHLKTFILDPLATTLAHQIVQKLTAQTVNWINSGFNGNPAYVSDPGKFFLGIGDTTAAQFLSSDPTMNSLCTPFRAQVRLALVKNYLAETDNTAYSCTLGALANNYQAFTKDFSQGGWNGWFSVTQNSQNNPYGAYLDAQNTLQAKIGTQTGQINAQLTQGGGFLSYQKCKSGSTTTTVQSSGGPSNLRTEQTPEEQQAAYNQCLEENSSAGEAVAEAECASILDNQSSSINSTIPAFTDGTGTSCASADMETVTPGSVIAGQLNKILPSGVDQLQLVTSINQIVSALLTEMFTKALGATGLNGLSQPGSGSTANGGNARASLTSQLNPSSGANIAQNTANLQAIISSVPPELKSKLPTPPGSPFIFLNGSNPTVVQSFDEFVDPGAQAIDPADGDISSKIISNTTGPTIAADGTQTYTVTYDVADSQGNAANEVTRTVQVQTITPTNAPGGTGGTTTSTTNAMCGSANGQNFSLAPTTNLCSQGDASVVTDSGQTWTWSCIVTHGANQSCAANKGSGSSGTSGGTSGNTGGSTAVSVTPTFLSYTVTSGQTSAPQQIVVQNTAVGGASVHWKIILTSNWMVATPSTLEGTLGSGSSVTLNLSANAASLPHFQYTGNVNVYATDAITGADLGNTTIPVNLTVN